MAAGGATLALRGPRFLAVALRAPFLAEDFRVVVFLVARFLVAVLRTAFRAVLRVAALRTPFLALVFLAGLRFLAVDFLAAVLRAVLRTPFFAVAFLAGLRFLVVALAIISPLDPDCRNLVDRQYARLTQ